MNPVTSNNRALAPHGSGDQKSTVSVSGYRGLNAQKALISRTHMIKIIKIIMMSITLHGSSMIELWVLRSLSWVVWYGHKHSPMHP